MHRIVWLCVLALVVGLVPALADITYTTSGVYIDKMGWNGTFNSTYDILSLNPLTNTITVGNTPVIAPLNLGEFIVGNNCNAGENCDQSGELKRMLTINGQQQLINLWNIHISTADTLTIAEGGPVYFAVDGGTLKVTPLGATIAPPGNFDRVTVQLDGRFEMVPEPGVVTLLTSMLVGLGSMVGLLRKRLS